MNYKGLNTSGENIVGAGLEGKEDNMKLTDPTVGSNPESIGSEPHRLSGFTSSFGPDAPFLSAL